MIIPHQQLSADALKGLIEEFATRDGTDYGVIEVALQRKADQISQQLQRGEVMVVFDAVTETVSILPAREAKLKEQQELSGRTTADEWFTSRSAVDDGDNQDVWPDDLNQARDDE